MSVYCLHYMGVGNLAILPEELVALVHDAREKGLSFAPTARAGSGDFALSFDDAHASVLDALAPLDSVGVTATVFVPTAFVGTHPRFLDWDDLRRLRDAGWTIGSHAETHVRLTERFYDEDASAHRLRLGRELGRSRETLEHELGIEVDQVAYPFGEADERVVQAAERAGYARGFIVGEGGDSPLRIGRVDPLIQPPASEQPIGISVVVPAYERMGILAQVVTRLASQSYPEDRYEVLVVDDGSTSDLSPIFEEMPSNVRMLRRDRSDATFRAGQARQMGAEHARFDMLSFLDADVLVADDFLWHLDWIHQRTPRAAVLGYLSGYNLHDLGFIHTLDSTRGDLGELATIPDRSREPSLRAHLDHVMWMDDPWTLCYTGNLSLPKALLHEVGGFASDFVGWGLEDVDLGLRLHRAGCEWRFARYARGIHVVDPDEGPPRNPFRKKRPSRADFDGYGDNLERLRRAHAGDAQVEGFVQRANEDVDETVGRPTTVGIECGGAARLRSRYHTALFQVIPGGVPYHEKLDRVAYAEKVGAKCVYLLGGAPAEQDGFLELVQAASAVVDWVSMETLVYPFAQDGFATRAFEKGLRGAVVVVHSFERDVHEELIGEYDAFVRGLDALADAGIELNARLIVSDATRPSLEATEAELHRRGIDVDERVLL